MESDVEDNVEMSIVRRDADQTQALVAHELTVAELVRRQKKIDEVMREVMREGQHYGKIPGCGDKPALFKAGAELLAMTFGLSPKFKVTRVDLPNGHREYEVICTLETFAGVVLGQGVGSCSTMESKYRWRKADRMCPNCGKATILRSKYPPKGQPDAQPGWYCFAKRGGCGAEWPAGAKEIESQETGRAENPDLADTYNTVLKMAKKRAHVDATLTATGASNVLTQDIEELGPGARDDGGYDEYATPTRSPTHYPRGFDDGAADFDDYPDSRPASRSANGHARSAGGRAAAAGKAAQDRWEVEADAVIDLIRQSRSPEEVKSLGPRASKIPKGTPARQRVSEAYAAQLKALTPPEAA